MNISTYLLSVEVPVRTIPLTNSREHWRRRARRVEDERVATKYAIRAAGGVAYMANALKDGYGVRIQLQRLAPAKMDDDNLPASMKSIRDQIAAELGVDDGSSRLTWEYSQTRTKRGHWGVMVTISVRKETP